MYSRADEYRRRAILAQQRAQRATDPTLREALGEVARDWFALAEQAEWLESHHKSRTDGAVGD
jgi:hypothetical protein